MCVMKTQMGLSFTQILFHRVPHVCGVHVLIELLIQTK